MKFLSQINVNTEYTLPIVDGTNGQVLATDGSGNVYWGTITAGSQTLDGLSDVIITSPSSGQLIRYGIPPGSGETQPVWYNFTPNYLTPSSSIDALGDVTITSATSGQVLTWNGSAWVNSAVTTAAYVSKIQHDTKAGTTIAKGQAVYVTGADGTNMIVGLASNASEATSSKTMGLAANAGATNATITVVTEGLLAGLDTSTASAGDPVWLGTGGNLIFGLLNKPVAPAHLVFIGIVTRVQQNNGEIFVKVQNGFELNEIHDVLITSPSLGQLLRRDSDGLWKNWTPNFLTSLPTHSHDDLYYTESEIIGFFGGELEIAGYNQTNWDTAYSWGNHAGLYAPLSHTHTIANITGLQTALDGKAASSHTHSASDITSGTISTSRLPLQELGVSIMGNFGQWQPHNTYTNLNTVVAYWGWNFVQGATNAPHQVSSQWYRGRFSLGDAYGLGNDPGDYWMEIAIPRYNQGDNAGNLFVRTCENGAINGWQGVRAAYATEAGTAGNSTTTSQTNFSTLTIANNAVATQAWVGLNYYNEGEIDDFFSGAEPISGYNKTNWDAAYNDKVNSASFNTANGVLTLTQQDGGTVTVDLDGRYLTSDTDAQTLTWDGGSKTLGITNGNDVILSELATEDFVTSQGYITGYTETDTLATVTGRGNTTTNAITVANVATSAGGVNGVRIHTNSGITASNNYMNFFTSQSSGWAFNANGTGADSDAKVVITAAGNVGIGTTSPANTLHTYGASGSTIAIDAGGANNSGLQFKTAGTLNAAITYVPGTNQLHFYRGGDVMVVGSSNVGIGTASPAYKLDVAGGNVRLSQGYESVRINGVDLLGYGNGNLWQIGNTTYSSLVLSTSWDWDRQVEFNYTPNTTGQVAGVLRIGQMQKNSATWTHGRTEFYVNGSVRSNINTYGVGIAREAASNEKLAIDLSNGVWGVHIYNAGTAIGGLHANSNVITLQSDGNRNVEIATGTGNANWNGNTIATRTWVQAQAYQPASTAITTSNIGSQSVAYASEAGFVSNQGGQLLRFDNRIISPSETNAGYLQFGFTSWANNNTGPWADYLHLRSYTDNSGGNDNLVMFKKSGIGMRIWQQTFGSSTAYSSYADVWTTENFTSTNVTNWNTAYGWGNHADAPYWNVSLNQNVQVESNQVTFVGDVVIQGTLTESSSIRFKENIQPLQPALGKVEQLNPVTYNKVGVEQDEIGLIAEDVAELFPEVVTYNEEGQPQGLNYSRLAVVLIKAVQELSAELKELKGGK